jgi:adenine deaminase
VTETVRNSAAERMHAAEVAAGERAADLVLRGGRVVEVHTGRILPLDVAVAGPRIAAVGDVSHCLDAATEMIDCAGLYVLPGFVEPHLHVGGSQLAVEGLAEVLLTRGTVAVGTCFYEPAVVAGGGAVEELLARAAETPLDVLLSPFHAAALGLGTFGNLRRFGLDDLVSLVRHPACVELREWNWNVARIPLPGLQEAWEAALAEGVTVGGHLEGLTGPSLQASVALGARSDHEAAAAEEAVEKARAGVTVQIREGSGARDLDRLVAAITEHGADPRCFAFSTDEQELASLLRDGHIDHKLRLAVARGVAPIDAVRMATLNAAACLGVDAHYGAIAAGRLASVALVEDLASFRVAACLARGRLVAEGGTYTARRRAARPYPTDWRKTVRFERRLEASDFLLDLSGRVASVRVIGITPGSLLTEELVEEVELEEGRLSAGSGLAKLAVLDRHEGGARGAVGLVRGLRLERGALASTVNPGMMNLMVVGVGEEDMALAANRVVELGGGIVVARDGEVTAQIALPLFGILSDAPVPDVAAACTAVDEAIAGLGSPEPGLLTTVGFACLAVSIPALKICDRGLVRVTRDSQEAVELVVSKLVEQ